MRTTFYDLLGIDPASASADSDAAALWPNDIASLTEGLGNKSDAELIVMALQDSLSFTNVRTGADSGVSLGSGAPGQITFAADLHVADGALTQPPCQFYLRSLPDLAIQISATDTAGQPLPASCFVAIDGRGFELIIDRLPVQFFLKPRLASKLDTQSNSTPGFEPTQDDSLAYDLSDGPQPSRIDAFVRIHLTPDKNLLIEPTVPISFGPVNFMGIPAKALYDLQIIPSPKWREPFEWTRNNIDSFLSNPPAKGAIGFRSIEVDFSLPPFADLKKRVQDGAVIADGTEIVLEDVVIPVAVPMLPVPSHGTFGFRRQIAVRGDIANAFSFSGTPLLIRFYKSSAQGGSGGSNLQLAIEKFFFASGQLGGGPTTKLPEVILQANLIWQTPSGTSMGVTVGIDDDWTIFAGMVWDNKSPVRFKILNVTVFVAGVRFGVSVGRLTRGNPFLDSFELLFDIGITAPAKAPSTFPFQICSLTGQPLSMVIRDLGWKLGKRSVQSLTTPDGTQIIFANMIHLIVLEAAWVEEPNGTPYFSFTGGVSISSGGGNKGNTAGIRFIRLRFRTKEDPTQPFFKLDGLYLNLQFGLVGIQGFGYITQGEDSGWSFKEWGFGVEVKFTALQIEYDIAAAFIKGSRRQDALPNAEFDYFLAFLSLSYLPVASIALYDIKLLVASNMVPKLDSQFPDGEGMALLKWYRSHDQGLEVPANRGLGDWVAQKGTLSWGVGCSFSFNGAGSLMKIDLFLFYVNSSTDASLLIVGKLFLLKVKNSIGYVAIEYDFTTGKFGVMVGVDLNLADLVPSLPPSFASLASLTGTIYFGNQPWQLAIGQLADQRSWLSIKGGFNIGINISFQFGLCLQIVDGGPKGFGMVFTLSASADWGIGAFLLFGSFGFIVGTWKTGSSDSGAEAWLTLGFKIRLFAVFTFGADISLKMIYVDPPWYVTVSAEIRIDTPWFLPSVTFHIDKTWQQPLPFDLPVLTPCLSSGQAIDAGQPKNTVLDTPGLTDNHADPKRLYSFKDLSALSGIRHASTKGLSLPVISTDSTVAINFTQPVTNDSAVAGPTVGNPGVQNVQDLQIRYGLKSIAVRRSPRFGPAAGTWTDFLKATDTTLSLSGSAPQTLTFAWDVDSRADGKLAPKRLLINSDSPYSFATSAPRTDEEAIRNDPGFPCCATLQNQDPLTKAHELDFLDLATGTRVPTGQQFTGQGAWWRWMLRPTPVISAAFGGVNAATFASASSEIIGLVDSPQALYCAEVTVAWEQQIGVLAFEQYDGLKLVKHQSVSLSAASGSKTLTYQVNLPSQGFSRIMLRVQKDQPTATKVPAVAQGQPAKLAVVRLGYVTLADKMAIRAAQGQCGNAANLGPPGTNGSGKLAFLPNHDYELVVNTQVTVTSRTQGARTYLLPEACYFSTKGLPGLNAVPNTGDDIRVHVESTYPSAREIPVYLEEPVVLAFTEGMSSILPVDRTPGSGDPPERAQMFPLILNVDRVGSLDGLKRLTVPNDDWISAHQSSPPPPVVYNVSSTFGINKVRQASTLDPQVLRYQAVRKAVAACGAPQSAFASQLLLHEPIDADGKPGFWEPQTGYRVTVRQQNGPYAERTQFDSGDLAAFVAQADGSATPGNWSLDANGNIVGPTVGTGRQYLCCGDPAWDHLQVQAAMDLQGATAGIAVGVQDGAPVATAILATVESNGTVHDLVLRRLDASGETELGRSPVTIAGQFTLRVVAFDDNIRASLGDVTVEGPRLNVREGRVALVSNGPAVFSGIQVDGLDIFTFDFQTSRFHSFAEHINSWDGQLLLSQSGSFGETPAKIADVMSQHGGEIASLMAPAADPQARQKLFSTIAGTMGIGLQKKATRLKITRLQDPSGTYGFLLESPDLLSFTRDVTAKLVAYIVQWVPAPVFAAVPNASASPIQNARVKTTEVPSDEGLMHARFTGNQVSLPRSLATYPTSGVLVRAVAHPDGPMLEVFDVPRGASSAVNAQGFLREIVPQFRAAGRQDLSGAAQLSAGDIAVLNASGQITGVWRGGIWRPEDVQIPLVVLSDGHETSVLLLANSGGDLSAGNYTLTLVIDRNRWRSDGSADPEHNYHSEQAIGITW